MLLYFSKILMHSKSYTANTHSCSLRVISKSSNFPAIILCWFLSSWKVSTICCWLGALVLAADLAAALEFAEESDAIFYRSSFEISYARITRNLIQRNGLGSSHDWSNERTNDERTNTSFSKEPRHISSERDMSHPKETASYFHYFSSGENGRPYDVVSSYTLIE